MINKGNLKQNKAKGTFILKTHLKAVKVVDGDGLIVQNILTNEEFEIRLLGIDAPEIKKCAKLKQDERETHLPGALLMQLGFMSFKFMIDQVPPNTNITLLQESKQMQDKYNRQLAYVVLPDGRILNEIMIEQGYAKPYNKFFCSELGNYQKLFQMARKSKKGLHKISSKF
jgi:micrococcal nuclease